MKDKKYLLLMVLLLITVSNSFSQVISDIVQYMKSEGWELIYLECTNIDGKDYLIMIDSSSVYGGKYYTSDIGYQISSYTFPKGYYFCKKRMMGGISEFINKSGSVIRLIMATWKEFN